MVHHKIFSLPRPLWAILFISNIFFARLVDDETGSYFGWLVVDLSSTPEFTLPAILAVLQFVLFALTVDMTIRLIVTIINRRLKAAQVPAITMIATSVVVYSVIGLVGFILLYDHSLTHILATAGALGLGVVYIFREWIADVTASIQIQTDHLVSINNYIEVEGEKDVYRITQIDHRHITIEDKFAYLIRIPTRQFLNWKYINLSKQPRKRGTRRRATFNLTTSNDSYRVIEMMHAGMRYLIAKNPSFNADYACHVQDINNGMITYGLVYECDPAISYFSSNNLVLSAMLHIFITAGINLYSDMELIPAPEELVDVRKRLLDIYQMSILRVLSREDVDRLSEVVRPVRFEEGQQIIQMGEPAQSMYFILEGHLDIQIPNQDGQPMVVATLWPGECVGEMSLLTGEPRSANVYAKSPGILLEIDKIDLEPILQKSPKLIEKISQLLFERQKSNAKTLGDSHNSASTQNGIKAIAKKIVHFFFG